MVSRIHELHNRFGLARLVVLLLSHVVLAAVVVTYFAVARSRVRKQGGSIRISSPPIITAKPSVSPIGIARSAAPTPSPSLAPVTRKPTAEPTLAKTSEPTDKLTASPTLETTPPPPLELLAYYYPWYIRDDWSQHGYVDTPLLGLYGTDDPVVVEQHIRWAQRAGLTAFVLSWWGPDALTAQHMATGFLPALAKLEEEDQQEGILWCINYETLGALPTTDFSVRAVNGTTSLALEALKRDFQHLESAYFSLSSYYRRNGKPVVVLYVTRTWTNFERWMLDDLQSALQEEVFLIADEPFFHDQQNPRTARNGLRGDDNIPLFDAYTTYNLFENALIHTNDSATDFMLREGLPIFEQWSAAATLLFPNVLPMYHDFRGHTPLPGDAAGLRTQLETFACLPRAAAASVVVEPKLLFVTSWNEWWEGSAMEPDNAHRYGFEFIDTLYNFTRDYASRDVLCADAGGTAADP